MRELLHKYEMLILASEDDEDFDPLWLKFFSVQMTLFIFIQPGFNIPKDKAHFAYKRIKEEYQELKEYLDKNEFDVKRIDNLIKSINISYNCENMTA